MIIFRKAHPATQAMSSAAKPADLNEGDIRRNPGEPDAKQAEASTYNKPRIEWQGLTIAIENPAGSVRRGRNRHGVTWEVRMRFDYGEILGSLGVDGDPVDVIVGPNLDAPMVYVVHQRKVNDWENYDEDKCCVGFDSEEEATQAFLSNYNDPRFLGPITALPVEEFVAKVRATKDKPAMIKSAAPVVLFFKARVGAYLRGGKLVNLAGYQGRTAKPKAHDGQLSLFAPPSVVMGPNRYKDKHPVHDTPDLFEPQHTEPTRELIEEHERLVDVLNSPSHEDDKVEAKKQEAELEEYKQEAGEVQNGQERCTSVTANALLDHFGLPKTSEKMITGIALMDELKQAGLTFKRVATPGNANGDYSVKEAKEAFPDGAFYLFGGKHAMALIDGKLVDAANGTDRRRVNVLQVVRKDLADNAPTKPHQTETPEFKRWFGDSVVTDDWEGGGKPRVLYHATPADFSEFKPGGHDEGRWRSGPAIWLTPHEDNQPAAHNVGGYKGVFKDGVNVMPLYAKIENPLYMDEFNRDEMRGRWTADSPGEFPQWMSPATVEKMRSGGFDGIIQFYTDRNGVDHHEVIVFDSKQLKSAIGNNGQFDPDNPDITKAQAAPILFVSRRRAS